MAKNPAAAFLLKLNLAERTAKVRELAREAGFDDCRIAPAVEAAHAAEYRAWLENGCHGTMDWMARDPERRSDPRVVVPGAKAVIVLAMNYKVAGTRTERGRIARYAWGKDYHDVIEPKLRALCEQLGLMGGHQRSYVDTGPVLERDFANEAGLGWNGKSTVQIHRRLGAWFFLAVIITTLELELDAPAKDHCGSCTRCITACPTQAITAPHRMDARRCISYLTIEQRGSIPEEFRRAIGDRIYGCDECLEVCPWNRFAQESQEIGYAAREFVTGEWDLRDFLALDEAGFRDLFRKSPIKRIKRRGFLRNVCVALGNVGTVEDLPALELAAMDEEPLIAEHAAWAIGEIQRRVG